MVDELDKHAAYMASQVANGSEHLSSLASCRRCGAMRQEAGNNGKASVVGHDNGRNQQQRLSRRRLKSAVIVNRGGVRNLPPSQYLQAKEPAGPAAGMALQANHTRRPCGKDENLDPSAFLQCAETRVLTT